MRSMLEFQTKNFSHTATYCNYYVSDTIQRSLHAVDWCLHEGQLMVITVSLSGQ